MGHATSYLELTKPRLLPLVLLSGLPAFGLANSGWPSPTVVAVVLVGTSLAAASANALNSYLERDLDARMERTRRRPLPAGRVSPAGAVAFGVAAGLLGVGILWFSGGPAASFLGLAAIASYLFLYTLWLKPRTPVAVLVGAFSGAVAPLIADVALDGRIGAAGWMLFAIVLVWQPPHFYAIALHRRCDYAAGGFPMLHDRVGERATCVRILLWICALIPLSLLPATLPALGGAYVMVAVGLGCWFLLEGVRLVRRPGGSAARRLFRVSLFYLTGILGTMIFMLLRV